MTIHEHGSAPLSHLTLERYALGELPPEQADYVAARLRASAADQAVLEAIQADTQGLPPLLLPEERAGQRGGSVLPWLRRRLGVDRGQEEQAGARFWGRGLWAGAGLAAAITAVLLVVVFPVAGPVTGPGEQGPAAATGAAIKGDEVVLSLVGQWSGVAPGTRRPGESLKLRVTCPPGQFQRARVTLFQGGQRYHPLPDVVRFACGNRTPWPGAFQVSGPEPARLCVSWGDDLQSPPQRSGAWTRCIAVPGLVPDAPEY